MYRCFVNVAYLSAIKGWADITIRCSFSGGSYIGNTVGAFQKYTVFKGNNTIRYPASQCRTVLEPGPVFGGPTPPGPSRFQARPVKVSGPAHSASNIFGPGPVRLNFKMSVRKR